MDGMLSQDEINALFSGMSDESADAESSSDVQPQETAAPGASNMGERIGDTLTDIEKDAIGEISNISMGTAATTLNALVGQPVNITTPTVSYGVWEDLASEFKERPCVALRLGYKEGLNGDNILLLKERDVMVITDLMMGGDGNNIDGELGELQLSAISEAMNQMMGSSATSLSSMINRKIDIFPPDAQIIDFNGKFDFKNDSFHMGEFVKVSFKMTIGTMVDSEIMQLYPLDFAKTLYDLFMGNNGDASEKEPEPAPQPAPMAQQPQNMAQPMPGMDQQMQMPGTDQQMPPGYGMQGQIPPGYGMPGQMPPGYGMQPGMQMPGMQMPYYGQPMPGYGMPYMPQQMPADGTQPQPGVNVQLAQFQGFNNNISPAQQKENIDLIMDVPLDVKVELGRTTRSIKDILEFSPGTVIELNKIAGEPVDILVNGKYVAKGEVVVLEESFAVRITEIINN